LRVAPLTCFAALYVEGPEAGVAEPFFFLDRLCDLCNGEIDDFPRCLLADVCGLGDLLCDFVNQLGLCHTLSPPLFVNRIIKRNPA